MSTSLKVVSIAAVFCASLSRRAIVWRNLVRRTRSSREASSGAEGVRKAIGAGSGASAGATGTAAGLTGSDLAASGLGVSDLAISCSTSPSSTWPRLPLPVTALRSMPFSTAIFAADGAGGIAVAAEGLEAGALASALAGADADAAVDADDTAPSNAPIDTVSPVWADTSDSTPGAGALISSVTLSVSSSTNGSSAFTASPRCLNHLPTVASVIDSPSVGTRISVAMAFAPSGALLLRGDGGNRRQGRHRTDPDRRHRKILVTEAAPRQDRGIASLQCLQPLARRHCRLAIPRSWRGAASVTRIFRCRRSGSVLWRPWRRFPPSPRNRRAPLGAKAMATEIRVPTLGESITEATVGKWFKQRGDAVKADEPLVELETDKVTLEINAPAPGVLSEVSAQTGETVSIGALLGALSPASTAASAPAKAEASAPASRASAATAMPPAPSAAKIAVENGIDLSAVTGSGKRGQVLEGDVLQEIAKSETPKPDAAKPEPAKPAAAPVAPAIAPLPSPIALRAPAKPDDASREERVRLTKLRQTIARRLKDAQNTAAMLTTFNEVDMTEIIGMRTRYKEPFEKKHGVKLGFMGFFVKACVQALKDVPAVNAEIDGADLVFKNYYHLGIAVGTDKGLVVPVVRDADRLSIAGIEKTIADYGKRAREGRLKIEEMQGGTFTITNGGIYGSLMSTPILNAPQSGILGMHKIQDRPMAVAGKIEIRPMMYLALSYDHRVVDGKEAVTFLVRVKEALEDPARLVLDL